MGTEVSPALERESVDYTDGSTVFEGYVARPADLTQDVPCVLLAHEWSGLNGAMNQIADRIAALGFVSFAVDVYGKGLRGDELGDNSHLMDPLMADRGLLRRRLLAGLSTAVRQPRVDASRIAAVGYCFGGLCALDLARAALPELRAVISVHGGLQPPRIGPQTHIGASILLLHGWEDPIVPAADVLAIATELTDAGADWQLHAYGHARHAFTFAGANFPERGIVYDAKADRRSWHAMKAFLAEQFAVEDAQMSVEREQCTLESSQGHQTRGPERHS